MEDADRIGLVRDGGVATITIDRPEKKNALTKGMFERLADLFEAATRETSDRVVVVRGTGDAFCAGADLTRTDEGPSLAEFGAIDGMQWMREINRCVVALHRLPKPTIAAVNGVAAGAGCNIALNCDIAIAAESARFSEIFVRRGLSVDFGGTWALPRVVGLQKAKDLCFRGEIISAKEALDLGMVLRVVPDEELDSVVDAYAAEIASLPPVPLMLMKYGLDQSFEWTMDQALEYEAHAQTTCFQTDDIREAITAWVEKRQGKFTGR